MSSPTLDWDYTELARHYERRAPYAESALRALFALMQLPAGSACIDIGAGTGRMTAALVAERLHVIAVEPNAAMRDIGRLQVPQAHWLAARGEATGLPDLSAQLITFGSSFNVLPAAQALGEAARLLVPEGWLVCLWNHRDLADPLQARLQSIIEAHVPGYRHGSRRDDPEPLIAADGRYDRFVHLQGTLTHVLPRADFVAGFRAHATLVRQAGERLPQVIDALDHALADCVEVAVPFVTRIHAARLRL